MQLIMFAKGTSNHTVSEYYHNHNQNHRKLTSNSVDTITVNKIVKAKFILNDILSLIFNRYQLADHNGESFFLTSNNMNSITWDLIKYKFATKFIKNQLKPQVVRRKRRRQLLNTQTYDDDDTFSRFLMIFSGSSVTAGHDNYYNNSFPMIVLKRLKPTFDALGIRLIVRNIAQGMHLMKSQNLLGFLLSMLCFCVYVVPHY